MMEFRQKLQELRKQKGLTQEELAAAIFVSRAAISKWESGRGYPNIDSLKAIAKFFSITIDELLSGEEVLTIAEADVRQTENRFLDRTFGILDCCALLFLFLPVLGQTTGEGVRSASLLTLSGVEPWLRAAYFAVIVAMTGAGVLTLLPASRRPAFWETHKRRLSLLLNAAGTLLFILSRQPYAASILFIFLTIKGRIPSKRR